MFSWFVQPASSMRGRKKRKLWVRIKQSDIIFRYFFYYFVQYYKREKVITKLLIPYYFIIKYVQL